MRYARTRPAGCSLLLLLASLSASAASTQGAITAAATASAFRTVPVDRRSSWLLDGDRVIYSSLRRDRLQQALNDSNSNVKQPLSGQNGPGGSSDDQQPDASTVFRWTGRNIATAAAVAVCALLANAAGLGGGPFFVPVLNTLAGFDLKLCSGLSHTLVVAGATASCAFGLTQRSPVNDKTTLVNLDIACILVPAMLGGISAGVVLNPLSPEWFQTALLSVLLVMVTHKTVKRGISQWCSEQAAISVDVFSSATATQPLLSAGSTHLSLTEAGLLSPRKSKGSSFLPPPPPPPGVFQRISFSKAGALVALWFAFVGLQVAKSQQPNCSWAYVGLTTLQISLLACFAAAFAYVQAWRAQRAPDSVDLELRKMMVPPSQQHTDGAFGELIVYQPLRLLQSAGMAAVAGVTAGLLGIAGAMLLNPLLVAEGVHPQVVAATAIVITLFGSGAITLSSYMNGMLNLSYLRELAPIAFVASLLGVTAVAWAIRRTGRQSVLLLLMGGVLATGAISVVVFGGERTVEDILDGRRIGFNPFCDN